MDAAFAGLLTGGVRFDGAADRQAMALFRPRRDGGGSAGPCTPAVPHVDTAVTKDPVETANLARKAYGIRVKGGGAGAAAASIPPPLQCFDDALPAARRKSKPHGGAAKPSRSADGAARTRAALQAALKSGGWTTPTPIQRQVIPLLLGGGADVLAIAPTGSGKTLAFLLPLVVQCARERDKERADGRKGRPPGPRALVLSPTRELAAQTARVLARLTTNEGGAAHRLRVKGALLTRGALTAGAAVGAGTDILLATPARLASAVAEKKVDLSAVRWLVLDEADRLLDAAGAGGGGGGEQDGGDGCTAQPRPPRSPPSSMLAAVDAILAACSHPRRVAALLSATMPAAVEALARTFLRAPVRVSAAGLGGGAKAGGGAHAVTDPRGSLAASVSHVLTFVGTGDAGKRLALRDLLAPGGGGVGPARTRATPPALVFVKAGDRAASVAADLAAAGVPSSAVSAASGHAARAAAVAGLRSGELWALVSTDVLARGLDFIGVRTVINYDCPATLEDYTHRVGRTGRAGSEGTAVTLWAEGDAPRLRGIASAVRAAGGDVPDWMLRLPAAGRKERAARKREVGSNGGGGAGGRVAKKRRG